MRGLHFNYVADTLKGTWRIAESTEGAGRLVPPGRWAVSLRRRAAPLTGYRSCECTAAVFLMVGTIGRAESSAGIQAFDSVAEGLQAQLVIVGARLGRPKSWQRCTSGV
jgi:hypothetical protein